MGRDIREGRGRCEVMKKLAKALVLILSVSLVCFPILQVGYAQGADAQGSIVEEQGSEATPASEEADESTAETGAAETGTTEGSTSSETPSTEAGTGQVASETTDANANAAAAGAAEATTVTADDDSQVARDVRGLLLTDEGHAVDGSHLWFDLSYSKKNASDTARPGDYLTLTLKGSDAARSTNLKVDPGHFSSVTTTQDENGDTVYHLVFGDLASSALAGGVMFSATANNQTDGPKQLEVDFGGISTLIVDGKNPDDDGGNDGDVLNKKVQSGSHYFSENYYIAGQESALSYRLLFNEESVYKGSITITDPIPQGASLVDGSLHVYQLVPMPKGSSRKYYRALDISLYASVRDGDIVIDLGDYYGASGMSLPIEVAYSLKVDPGWASDIVNVATASWTDESGSHSVSSQVRMYTGNENSAAFGIKTVDRTVVSTDPDDQLVTYTIKFWNDQGFAAGAIQLVDELDPHVRFVSAEPNEYYVVEQDPNDPQRLVIRNTKDIDGSLETYATFTTDFTNVPVGYTVANTVGGNTTKTTKCGGGLVLTAQKTIDGSGTPSDGQFAFELLSADGTVLQTKRNGGDGVVTFDEIPYTTDDVGKTFVYQVREVAGDGGAYRYDGSVYAVSVTPELELDADGNPTGRILAVPSYEKDDVAAVAIEFDNATVTPPHDDGHGNQAGETSVKPASKALPSTGDAALAAPILPMAAIAAALIAGSVLAGRNRQR